jgi:hypothetical protein
MTESAAPWRVFRLGDVVENVNEYCGISFDEPERYIAGDHIDEGSTTRPEGRRAPVREAAS